MKPNYTILDHTADLRIRIAGSNPADLFINAGMALSDLIAGPLSESPEAWISLTISADDLPDLVVNFLRELLYLWAGENKLVTVVHIVNITETDVEARVGVVDYLPAVHTIAHEIKAVTYHQIQVAPTPTGWLAIVVFDV